MLKHALAATLVVGFLVPVAQADLIPGDPIDIVGTFNGEAVWGTGIFGGETHPFLAETNYIDQFLFTTILVTSFELPPPPGKKFAGQIDISYDPVYLDNFHTEGIDITGIKEPGGSNFINSVEAFGASGNPIGLISTDGFNIHFEAFSGDILLNGGGIVSIVWTQVPAPGALALLGLAGLCGTRRRRR